ncbi:MAG: polyprenol monophosphomannose synthase [Candidatus Brocadiia bacterium]
MGRAADELSTLVVVPTYNERENIVRLLREILRQGSAVEVLVVDDNSPDGTPELVEQMADDGPRVHLLRREGKLGLGTAHIAGYRWALGRDYSRVITMDADFSHPPERIPAMLEASREADVVIGSRYCPGGGHEQWPFHRILLSSTSNVVARLCLRLKPADCTGAFRCFRRSVLENIATENIVSRGYSFQEEMLWHCSGRGWRIAEVPITFQDRRGGESKMSLREIFGGVATIVRLVFTPEGRKMPSRAAPSGRDRGVAVGRGRD